MGLSLQVTSGLAEMGKSKSDLYLRKLQVVKKDDGEG